MIQTTDPAWAFLLANEILNATTFCGAQCDLYGPDDRDIDFSCCDDRHPCTLRLMFSDKIVTPDKCDQSRVLEVTLALDLCVDSDDSMPEQDLLRERSELRYRILAGVLEWRRTHGCSFVTIRGWESEGLVGECFRWTLEVMVEEPILISM